MKLLANCLMIIGILIFIVGFPLSLKFHLFLLYPTGILIYFIGGLILTKISIPDNDIDVWRRKQLIKAYIIGIIFSLPAIFIASYVIFKIYN